MDKKKIDILNDIMIAHRGLCDSKYPENSLGSFENCVKKGIPIELDVHILKDNTLVVYHDDDTGRLTDKKIILKNAVHDDIKDLRIEGSKYKIPTLKEVLDLVNGKVLLDIELKVEVRNFRICYEISKLLDNYGGEFVIKSFNPAYIWWFKKYRPEFIRGILVSRLKDTSMSKILKRILYNMSFNFLANPDFIAFDYRDLPNKKIDKLYADGVPILLFTVMENEKIEYKYSGLIYKGE